MKRDIQIKLLNIVKQNYEEISDDFSQKREKLFWPELTKISSEVSDKNSILDVGCGNGRLLNLFKDKKISYLGVDSSEGLISHAKKIYNKENIEFEIGDILDLSSINRKFDYVFCIAVLAHIPGKNLQQKALEELKNKVKDDGKIVLVVWNLWKSKKHKKLVCKFSLEKILGKNKMDFGDIVFPWKNNKGEEISQRYYHAFKKRELKKLSKKAGLKIEKIYKDKWNYYLILKRQISDNIA